MDKMLTDISAGIILQYGANRDTSTIYATGVEDYEPGKTNVMDVLTVVVDMLAKLGYGAVRSVGVFVPPDIWESRLDLRFQNMDSAEIAGRINEGERSTKQLVETWGLRRDRLLLISTPEHDADNRRAIQTFIESGVTIPSHEAIDTGHAMLDAIPRLRKKYL